MGGSLRAMSLSSDREHDSVQRLIRTTNGVTWYGRSGGRVNTHLVRVAPIGVRGSGRYVLVAALVHVLHSVVLNGRIYLGHVGVRERCCRPAWCAHCLSGTSGRASAGNAHQPVGGRHQHAVVHLLGRQCPEPGTRPSALSVAVEVLSKPQALGTANCGGRSGRPSGCHRWCRLP